MRQTPHRDVWSIVKLGIHTVAGISGVKAHLAEREAASRGIPRAHSVLHKRGRRADYFGLGLQATRGCRVATAPAAMPRSLPCRHRRRLWGSSRASEAPDRRHCHGRCARTSCGTAGTPCDSMTTGTLAWLVCASPDPADRGVSSSGAHVMFLGVTPAARLKAMTGFGRASGDARGATSLAHRGRSTVAQGFRDCVGAPP